MKMLICNSLTQFRIERDECSECFRFNSNGLFYLNFSICLFICFVLFCLFVIFVLCFVESLNLF